MAGYIGKQAVVLSTTAADVDGDALIEGNVGIGTDSPSQKLHVVETSGNDVATLESTSSSACRLYFKNTGNTLGNTQIWAQNNDLVFNTNGSEEVRILSSGGITFNGDTAAANALDDYEEGTWTPTLPEGGTATVVTGTNATYTKIGRIVTVSAYLQLSSIPNDSDNFKIGGLPFSAPLTVNPYGSGSFSYTGSANTNNMIGPVIHPSSYLYFHRNDGSNVAIKNSDAVSKSLALLIFTATYMTTA